MCIIAVLQYYRSVLQCWLHVKFEQGSLPRPSAFWMSVIVPGTLQNYKKYPEIWSASTLRSQLVWSIWRFGGNRRDDNKNRSDFLPWREVQSKWRCEVGKNKDLISHTFRKPEGHMAILSSLSPVRSFNSTRVTRSQLWLGTDGTCIKMALISQHCQFL